MLKKQTLDGNVETFLLVILNQGPSYGYAIVQDLNEKAQGLLNMGEGTVYPVLHRMEEKKLIASTWRQSDSGRKRKYYRVTPKGRKMLESKEQQWQTLSKTMELFLGPVETNHKPQNA